MSEFKKLFEKNQKIIDLEKQFELIPFQWAYIKNHFYFGIFFILISFTSLVFAQYYLSLMSLFIALLFVSNYHYSYRKWSDRNKKLIKEYAEIFKLTELLKKEQTDFMTQNITIQKNHLGLIKSDDNSLPENV